MAGELHSARVTVQFHDHTGEDQDNSLLLQELLELRLHTSAVAFLAPHSVCWTGEHGASAPDASPSGG